MISPTIGRVVLVHRPGRSDQRETASIAYVHNDRLVNVGGFDANGQPFAVTSLKLLQDNDVGTEGEQFAEWMPYQKGQAVKAEALEQKLVTA